MKRITCLLLLVMCGCGTSHKAGELVVIRGIENKPWIVAKSVADMEQIDRALSATTPTAMPDKSFSIPYPVEATVKGQSGRYVEVQITTYEAMDIVGFVDSSKVTIKPATPLETVPAAHDREQIIAAQAKAK